MTEVRIQGFRIGDRLGSGAMGTVYLGRVTEAREGLGPGDRVAVKVLHEHLAEDGDAVERFLREAAAGCRIVHENVVRTFLAGRTGSGAVPFLVMEYFEGRTLRNLLDELGTLPETLLREIVRQAAAGLAAIHEAKVVHRDLKPENILIAEDQRVRITDLGVARLLDASVALTHEGSFAGTLLYAAPEQFRGSEVDSRADLYSLGVVLLEMATGANPFSGPDAAHVISAHLNVAAPDAEDLPRELSPFFARLLSGLLAKRPEDRIPTASRLLEIIEEGESSNWWRGVSAEAAASRARLPVLQVRRETPVIGRVRELAELDDALDHALRGEGRAMLIRGEAGIGRTRLVDAFLERHRGEEIQVAYGSFIQGGRLEGFADAVIGLLGAVDPADAVGPYLNAAPRLVESFVAQMWREESKSRVEPIGRDVLGALMVRLLRSLSAERTLLWIVEDLHFAEDDVWSIFLDLARAVEGARALVIGTIRSGAAEADRAEDPAYRIVELGRLPPSDLDRMVSAALGDCTPAPSLGQLVREQSDGIPLFVLEVLDDLKSRGFVSESPDGIGILAAPIERTPLPGTVREILRARFRSVAAEDRELLEIAAVQGFEFDPDLLAAVQDVKPLRVLQRLATLERETGLVRAHGAGVRFDHHLLRQTIYEEIPDALRREYHSAIADAALARWRDEGRRDVPSNELRVFVAHHHLRGARPARAIPDLRFALRHLLRSYRPKEALDLAGGALAIPELLSDRERIDTLLAKAGCLENLGRWPQQAEALAECLRLADGSGEEVPAIRARVSLALNRRRTGDAGAAGRWLRGALDRAEAVGDQALLATVLRHLGTIAADAADLESARESFERALSVSERAGDLEGVAAARSNLGVVRKNQGRFEEARECFEESARAYRDLEDPKGEAVSTGNLGTLLFRMGRFDEALQCQESAVDLAHRIGVRWWEMAAAANLGNTLLAVGMGERAVALYERSRLIARETGLRRGEAIALMSLAVAFARMGAGDLAAEYQLRASEIVEEPADDELRAFLLVTRGLLSEMADDLSAAVVSYESALEARGRNAPAGARAPRWLSLGRALLLNSEHGRAESALWTAHRLAEESSDVATMVLARAHLSGIDVSVLPGAVREFLKSRERLSVSARIEAAAALHQAGGEWWLLEEAKHAVDTFRNGATADLREAVVSRVRLHRDVVRRWESRPRSE